MSTPFYAAVVSYYPRFSLSAIFLAKTENIFVELVAENDKDATKEAEELKEVMATNWKYRHIHSVGVIEVNRFVATVWSPADGQWKTDIC
jgi:hypothetical protein